MKAKPLLSDLRSIRTRFSLTTGCGLLLLLLVFYLGGRYILVHMIRDAEKSIQLIGTEVKQIVYGEVGNLQESAILIANGLTSLAASQREAYLQRKLNPAATESPVTLLVLLDPSGVFQHGVFRLPAMPVERIDPLEIFTYLNSLPACLDTNQSGRITSGVIAFRQKPLFIAVTPVRDPEARITGFLMAGSQCTHPALLTRINQATHGMLVTVAEKPRAPTVRSKTRMSRNGLLAPIFNSAMNYYAGGRWHLGDNAFEAVLPLQDILGQQVSTISIRLPQSFSSLAQIALGWLTVFVASVGIVFIIPLFWMQSRILLNPLSILSAEIRRVGNSTFDSACPEINWPCKDEFGELAQSVNHMLRALVRKTQQVGLVEQRQRALITGMPDGLCVFDADASLVAIHKQPDYANPIPGLVAGHPLKPPVFETRDCDALRDAIGDALKTGKIQVVHLACRTTDHEALRHFETRVCRMETGLALVIFRDVTTECRERTTRLQIEERLTKIQKMESLGNLAAGIAHDFNNILSIIQNTVEVTWETPDPETREAITTICQATGKGAALTRELMTYAGQTRILFKRDDPNTLIKDLEKLMGGVVAANVSIELRLTPDLPHVDTDPQQFWKVVINLLKNASEAMNGARGHICISTYTLTLTEQNLGDFLSTQSLTPGNGVVFQIDDTGSGIPREMITHLFEPFFSTKSMGRGLGLATVFAIVDAHNGGIAIASTPGKGTTFRIWLPAAASATPSASPAHTQSHPASLNLPPDHQTRQPPAAVTPRAPCVLLIEDDKAILTSTSIVLRSLNVEILTAATKREALAIFRKQAETISLVLLDAHIGHLDNVRLLSTLRLRNPHVPIVVISGYNEKRIREMFAAESYEGFLAKPYTRDELKTVLDRYTIRTDA